MPSAFRVREHLTVDIVRAINLDEWNKGREYYFGESQTWWRPDQEVLRGIENPTFPVQPLIDAIPETSTNLEALRQAWAMHMAINAGCHPWPNANHRTALLSFSFALGQAGLPRLGFPRPEDGHELITASHKQRDGDGGEYALEELLDAKHVYRQLFASFAQRLIAN